MGSSSQRREISQLGGGGPGGTKAPDGERHGSSMDGRRRPGQNAPLRRGAAGPTVGTQAAGH
jgi:hypothetical protein